MIRPFLTGAALGLGLWLMVRGWFPAPVDLRTKLARYADIQTRPRGAARIDSIIGRPAVWLLRSVRAETLEQIEADLAVTDGELTAYAVEKLKVGAALMVLFPIVGYFVGFAHSLLAAVIIGVAAFATGYLIPDIDLKQKAAVRRQEFSEVLTGFVGLIAVSISGGGGVNTAMLDATSIGEGWCFDTIRRSIDEAFLAGESPWTAFERLGRRIGVISLVELASALALAGNSGARVVETLRARAEAGRDRELSDAMSKAERKSESMSIPIAAMLLGWFGFLGYPAVANLIGS
jgi:tight adherence protein C